MQRSPNPRVPCSRLPLPVSAQLKVKAAHYQLDPCYTVQPVADGIPRYVIQELPLTH